MRFAFNCAERVWHSGVAFKGHPDAVSMSCVHMLTCPTVQPAIFDLGFNPSLKSARKKKPHDKHALSSSLNFLSVSQVNVHQASFLLMGFGPVNPVPLVHTRQSQVEFCASHVGEAS